MNDREGFTPRPFVKPPRFYPPMQYGPVVPAMASGIPVFVYPPQAAAFRCLPLNGSFVPPFTPHGYFPRNASSNTRLNPVPPRYLNHHQVNINLPISCKVSVNNSWKPSFLVDNSGRDGQYPNCNQASDDHAVDRSKCGSKISRDGLKNELDDMADQLKRALKLKDEPNKKTDEKKPYQSHRCDKRGQWIASQRLRCLKRTTLCRSNINKLNAPFLAVFETLVPDDNQNAKQKHLLTVLAKLVTQEWPEARLYPYGSSTNSLGLPQSDIDVSLEMGHDNINKAEILLKLADIFRLESFQDVKAITNARVPILKLMDPVTGISCDMGVNNTLAVENTKLLRDYARIDVRLRQLVLIVKHWAKSRRVNETYQGTLSSYAYVLMCIHFLQQRKPAILPCLQQMETTHRATVDGIECAYFDKVERLRGYGDQNGESVAQLVWGFFHYWAYCHDYLNDVISVRTGSTLSKGMKNWTKRVGKEGHLICIEDPFDLSHDLGRGVDKFTVRVLREEFERAAEIMQYDPNPSITMFEPNVPD